MAELWALLHFIMPTLFDSHDLFNQWFSKDIESHAQTQSGELDQQQVSRLHMILKPFMLRRIKRDVANEMAEKIEKEVKCSMSGRQKRLYEAIRAKISVGDLVRNADHLMNLVMQLRNASTTPSTVPASAIATATEPASSATQRARASAIPDTPARTVF
jgi:DNA helicase INO80